MAGLFDDIQDDEAPAAEAKTPGLFDDIENDVSREDEDWAQPQPEKGIVERAREGWKDYHPPVNFNDIYESNWFKSFEANNPTAGRIARHVINNSPMGWLNRALGAVPGAVSAGAGAAAGVFEAAGMSRADADRLQRDLTIAGYGAQVEPGIGLAGQVHAARPNMRLAEEAQRRVPEPPSAAEEQQFWEREQGTRPPPPPPRPKEPPKPGGFKEYMEARREFEQRGPDSWENPQGEKGAIHIDEDGYGVYFNGAFNKGFPTREAAAEYLRSKGFAEQAKEAPGAEAGPEAAPGAGPGGPEPGPEPGPQAEPGPEPGPRPGAGPQAEEPPPPPPPEEPPEAPTTQAGFVRPPMVPREPPIVRPPPEPPRAPEAAPPTVRPVPEEPPPAEPGPPRAEPPEVQPERFFDDVEPDVAPERVTEPVPETAQPAAAPPGRRRKTDKEAYPTSTREDVTPEEAQRATVERPVVEPTPQNETQAQAIQLAKEIMAIGTKEAEGFAKAVYSGIGARSYDKPESIEFLRKKLNDFRVQAAGKGREAGPIKPQSEPTWFYDFLRPGYRMQLGDIMTRAKRRGATQERVDLASLLQRAELRAQQLIGEVNQAGWRMVDALKNPAESGAPPEIKQKAQNATFIGGDVERLLEGLKPRKGRDQAKRFAEDTQRLREQMGELERAPPEVRRESLSDFVKRMGGVYSKDKNIQDFKDILGGTGKALIPYVKSKGRLLEKMAEAAAEQGYIPKEGDFTRAFLEAFDKDIRARGKGGDPQQRVYPARAGQEAPAQRPMNERDQEIQVLTERIKGVYEREAADPRDFDQDVAIEAAHLLYNGEVKQSGTRPNYPIEMDAYDQAVVNIWERVNADATGVRGGGEEGYPPRSEAAGPGGEEAPSAERKKPSGAGAAGPAPGEAVRRQPVAFNRNEVSPVNREFAELSLYRSTGRMNIPILDSIPLRKALVEHPYRGEVTGVSRRIIDWIEKRLVQLVGDEPVHFLTERDLQAFTHNENYPVTRYNGYYWLGEGRQGEQRSGIFLNADFVLAGDREHAAATVLHEGVHAATALSIIRNPKLNTAIKYLINYLEGKIKNEAGARPYAFENPMEFVAETLSNKYFQVAMHNMRAPKNMSAHLDHLLGHKASAWDAMVEVTRRALGFPERMRGPLDAIMDVDGATILDHALTLAAEAMKEKPEHNFRPGMTNAEIVDRAREVRRDTEVGNAIKEEGPKPGEYVLIPRATLHGPGKLRARVERVLPDGRLEVRGTDGGIYKVRPEELLKRPTEEPGVEGKPQTVIPGAEQREGEMLQRRANAPLKPKVAQKGMDFGMFGDESKQQDLFSAPKPKEQVPDKPTVPPSMDLFGGAGGGGKKPTGFGMASSPRRARRERWDQKFVRRFKETFDPGRVSEAALQAEPLFGERNSRIAQAQDKLYREGDRRYRAWNVIPEERQLQFMHDIETAMPVEPKFQGTVTTPHARAGYWRPLRAVADVYRKLLDEAFLQEQLWGSKASYHADYFPHIWDRPEQFAAHMAGTHGATWFQKRRTFELIEDGLAAGFELKSTNPEALIRDRLMAGADMRETMRLLYSLQDIRQAVQARGTNQNMAAQGWREIVAPDREKWFISPDVQPLWDNAVKAKGLWAHEGLTGDAFRAWMGFKNVWVPIRLSLSAFHPLHVAGINTAHYWAVALEQAARGRLIGASASLARSISPYQGKGRKARKGWLKDPSQRTPWEQNAVTLMHEGGFSPMLSEQLRIDASKRISDAFRESSPIKLPVQLTYHSLRRVIQSVQSGIFEHWIPHLKTAAYLNQASALLRRRPDLNNDPVRRGVALRAIGKGIDDRFGEMFYSNLFWNRTLKDVGIGGFLSLGWNLGFLRTFGGGALEMIARPVGKVTRPLGITKPLSQSRRDIRDATNKVKFMSIYLLQGAIIAGMISMLMGGKKADELTNDDLTFPAAGGKNPDGSDRRYNTMWYNREVPMVRKHIEEQGGGLGGWFWGLTAAVWNKLLFAPLIQFFTNRNYWGQEISDPAASQFKQIEQTLNWIIKEQFQPMAVTGAKRVRDTGGTKTQEFMSYLGFGPAPAYVGRTAIENEISHMYREYVLPPKRPYKDPDELEARAAATSGLQRAIQSGDQAAIRAASDAAIKAGASVRYVRETLAGVTAMDRMFKRLPAEKQIEIVDKAEGAEKTRWGKQLTKRAREIWEKEKGTPPRFADGGPVTDDGGPLISSDPSTLPERITRLQAMPVWQDSSIGQAFNPLLNVGKGLASVAAHPDMSPHDAFFQGYNGAPAAQATATQQPSASDSSAPEAAAEAPMAGTVNPIFALQPRADGGPVNARLKRAPNRELPMEGRRAPIDPKWEEVPSSENIEDRRGDTGDQIVNTLLAPTGFNAKEWGIQLRHPLTPIKESMPWRDRSRGGLVP